MGIFGNNKLTGNFKLNSTYQPTGDQPEAIDRLTAGVEAGIQEQTLLGVTGSGKTFTMANIIARVNKPTLVLAHNKTLAAQLCGEFREFFPDNAVEYFVSYYDYYQPEAYIPGKDLYIEKDSAVNDEIDRLRHSATSALFERRDVIIVASVSCIYSLGDPNAYEEQVLALRVGATLSREEMIARLIAMNYTRNDLAFARDRFRVRGDVVEVLPASQDKKAIRVEFWGDEIERITEAHVVTGEVLRSISYACIFPATHYAISEDRREAAFEEIYSEMEERVKWFKEQNKYIEAQRIEERTKYDLEMLREVGFCSGVENYSRIFSGRPAGSTPYTLLDYFPDDFLMFIDESHVTLPQVRGMSGGDSARKKSLVDFGFRLPSAYDNRPLYFHEFEKKINQVIYVSATPGEYERSRSGQIAEQLIRPTGLVDPKVEVRPIEGQIDDLMGEIRIRAERGERVLVTTLTKKMAEDLTEYLEMNLIKVKYIHHNVETVERTEIIRDLRLGVFDVLVGVNLLREGLDIPEVSLVAILDADKEGFLRGETALIQTIGRAARNAEGRVIMYADKMTASMQAAIRETDRRRAIQEAYNEANGIVPQTIIKPVRELIDLGSKDEDKDKKKGKGKPGRPPKVAPVPESIPELEKQMRDAAARLDFETAAELRDRIRALQGN
ncbi:MAG: excinuclease ABC subunit UvrB [Clostridia bacterium]|nr:excinuclease ABC subunit UvrB [Clostridia bacterium]